MDIPRSLRSIVRSFRGERKRVKLTLSSGSTTVEANGILRIRLPERSLVDLGSFGFHGIANLDAGEAIAGTHTLIRRLGMSLGGTNVGYANTQYNQVAQAYNIASRGVEADEANACSGMYVKDMILDGDRIEANYFPLSPLSMGFLWTEAFGNCEIDINFAGAEALVTTPATSPTGTWSISDLEAFVDVIQLENDSYPEAIRSALESGQAYEKVVQHAMAVIQENTGSNSLNISTTCLDKVLFAPKSSTYLTRAGQADGQVFNNYLDFPTGETAPGQNVGVYVSIGSSVFPQQGYMNYWQDTAQLTRGCFGNGVYNFNKLFLETDGSGVLLGSNLQYDRDAYTERNSVVMISVGSFDEEGQLGGLNLSSGQSVVIFNSTGTNLLNQKVLIGGIFKSVLQARSGKVVSLQM